MESDVRTSSHPSRRVLGTLVAFLAVTGMGLTACSDNEPTGPSISGDSPAGVTVPTLPPTTTTPAPGATTAAEADIVTIAESAGDFATLLAAVEAAGLTETLQGDGPYTVFAPTDAAFEAALTDLGLTAEELLADTETLTSILTYHVVEGEVLAADVVGLDGQSVATVNGAELDISVDGEAVMINDATVTQADVVASNGVIHVIDQVLVPPAG